MRINVRGGTVRHDGDTLCQTCRHSRVTRGRKIDEELVFCDASHSATVQIAFKVTSCSDYADQRTPSYLELMHQAWILQPGSPKRPAAFVRAADLQGEELGRHLIPVRRPGDM